jgi:hypothetical protein
MPAAAAAGHHERPEYPAIFRFIKTTAAGQYDTNPFQPSWENPIAYMFGPEQEATDTRIFGNINAEATIFKGFSASKQTSELTLMPTSGITTSTLSAPILVETKTGSGKPINPIPISWLWENTANYTAAFGRNNLAFLAGSSIQKSRWSSSYLEGNDFPDRMYR